MHVTTPAETRWLNGREMEAWLALVRVLRTLPGALDCQLRAMANMSMFDYLTLAMLSEAPGRTLTCSELARQVDSSLSRMSHALDRFEDRGWVTRSEHEGDRRITYARLTKKGMRVVSRVAPAHVESVRSLVFDSLTADDVLHLTRICQAISPPAHQ